MQPANVLGKYAVGVKRKKSQVVDHLLLGKFKKLTKTVFYFLKASETNDCIVVVCGKPVKKSDGKGLKVPCTLRFTAEGRFIRNIKGPIKDTLID